MGESTRPATLDTEVLPRTMQSIWTWLVPENATRLPGRSYLILALMALALHLPGQVGVPAMDRDEARFAQATKQMIASGDFVDIRLGNDPRYLQPIGIYWLQAIPASIAGGETAPITAFRIPSLFAALGAVLLTAWLGTHFAGATVGFSAGILLAMSLLVSVESHFAKTDSTLLLSTLAAQSALWFVFREGDHGRVPFVGPPLAFWLALSIGILIKGPIIVLVVGLTAATFAIWNRSVRFLIALRPILGLPIVALIVAPWLIAINAQTDGEFFRVAIGHSFGGKIAGAHDKHGAPPGYHVALFMLTFFPGGLLLGVAAIRAFLHRADPPTRFLVSWIVPTFVMFEFAGTKLPHYTLPTFPAIAILVAWGLKDAGSLLSSASARWVHGISVFLFILAATAVAAVPALGQKEFTNSVGADAFFAFLIGLGVLAAGLFLAVRPVPRRLLPLFATLVLTYGFTFQIVIPSIDEMWVSDRAARELSALEGCDRLRIATAGYREPSNLFHFGNDTFLATDGAAAARFLDRHAYCGMLMLDRSERSSFEREAAQLELGFKSLGRISGRNYVDGAELEIDYVVTQRSNLSLPTRNTAVRAN